MQSFSGLHRYIMERGCKFVMEREKSMKKTIGSTLLLLLLFSNVMTLFFVCNSKKAFASGGNQSEAETWEPADDMPHLSTPDENDITENEAIDIAKRTLVNKFGYADMYFNDSEIECGFYVIPPEYSEYNCDEIWRVELRKQETGTAPFMVEMSGDGNVLMYKAPTTLPYYGNENILAEARPAAHTRVDATEEQVIAELRSCMYELGGFSELDIPALLIKTHFIYHERFCYGREPVWYSEIFQGNKQIGKAVSGFDGNLIDIATCDQEFTNTIRKGFWDGVANDFDISDFWYGSLSEKAALSEKWIPIVQSLEIEDPYFSTRYPILYAFTRHRYGMPDQDNVQLDAALEAAKNAAFALGASKGSYSSRSIEYLFDVTDASHPSWKIIIYEANVSKDLRLKDGNLLRFRVEINANTGEINHAYVIDIETPVLDWRL